VLKIFRKKEKKMKKVNFKNSIFSVVSFISSILKEIKEFQKLRFIDKKIVEELILSKILEEKKMKKLKRKKRKKKFGPFFTLANNIKVISFFLNLKKKDKFEEERINELIEKMILKRKKEVGLNKAGFSLIERKEKKEEKKNKVKILPDPYRVIYLQGHGLKREDAYAQALEEKEKSLEKAEKRKRRKGYFHPDMERARDYLQKEKKTYDKRWKKKRKKEKREKKKKEKKKKKKKKKKI